MQVRRVARCLLRGSLLVLALLFAFGGAEIEVLAPLDDYVPADDAKNNDSLVWRGRDAERRQAPA